jgi:hypothetical protein
MKRYAVTVVACLLVATVAFSLGVGVKPVELPPPIGLVDEAGSRSGEGAGERRMRASGAVAQRWARVRGDRRRSRPRPAVTGRAARRAVASRAARRDGARRAVRRSRASAGAAADDGAGDDDVAPEPSDGGEEDAGADGAAPEPSDDGEDDADTDDQQAERDDVADDPDD